MNTDAALGRCISFLNYQMRPADQLVIARDEPHPRAVTISRQAGCGALAVAEKLSELLQPETPVNQPRWTVFDKNLMEKVLEDHHLPTRLVKYLPEDRVGELQGIADELFGLRPASWTMIEQTAETLLKLAELGNVILIGRGGNIVTSRLHHVFHVRLVAPLEKRVAHARQAYQMNEDEARAFCRREDAGRQRYVKKYFKADSDNPLLYHLILNTGLMSFDEAARLIAEALRAPRAKLTAKPQSLAYEMRASD